MNAIDALKAVRALLAEPGKWTRRTFARDANGAAVAFYDQSATCFCVIGAIRKVGGHVDTLEHLLEEQLPPGFKRRWAGKRPLVNFNDSLRGPSRMLLVLDRAIAKEEA